MEKGWKGLPFRPISEFYKNKFGDKVYKIPLSIVEDCPNRRGLKGMETCIFCDVWGSAAREQSFEMTLNEQIDQFREVISKRFKAHTFLAYFQAYTNTFTKVQSLRTHFEEVMKRDFIKGIVVGTRPDCLSPAVMNLWQEFHEKSFVAVELGVQSFFDDQLLFMKRGHTRAQSLEAILKIRENTQVDLGIHLMFGLPGETDEQIIETAQICSDLPIQNVKLHNLHVLTNTPLEKLYHQGEFQPIERELYAHRVALFLDHLAPHIYVHRLAAFASRWDELVAPIWARDKMGTHQFIVDTMRNQQSYQSQKHFCTSPQETILQEELRIKAQPTGE
jgi:radical SAM protein (TIGR01212 family)